MIILLKCLKMCNKVCNNFLKVVQEIQQFRVEPVKETFSKIKIPILLKEDILKDNKIDEKADLNFDIKLEIRGMNNLSELIKKYFGKTTKNK